MREAFILHAAQGRMDGMSKIAIIVSAMASAMLLACLATVLTAVAGGKPQTVTLVGAGDIAGCEFKPDRKTARLVGNIAGTVFTLGDNVYPEGTSAQFRNCYDLNLGQVQRSARGPQPATRTTKPRGEALLRLLRMAGGKPTRATTLMIAGLGTSWP